MTTKRKAAIGIDLGGTFTKAMLADESGKPLESRKIPTRVTDGPETVISDMATLICEFLKAAKERKMEVVGAGIGCPGTVDDAFETVVVAPNLKWENVPVHRELEKLTGLKCFLDNDANLAAYGELRFGGGRGVSNFVSLTLGTGVGGGIIIDGELYRGSNNNAGEIGHMTVDLNGERCPCGNYGCLERYASASAIERRMKAMLERKPPASGKMEGDLTAKDIFKMAADGDIIARNVILSASEFLGIAIVNLSNILNPEKIILGGGMAKAGEALITPVMKIVRERLYGSVASKITIEKSKLENKAGVLGGIAFAFESSAGHESIGRKSSKRKVM
jgi:glucokinase